jgi:hypothetical protein
VKTTTYLKARDGSVTVTEDIRIPEQFADLPRIGLVRAAGRAEHLTWLDAARTSRIPTVSAGRVRSVRLDRDRSVRRT